MPDSSKMNVAHREVDSENFTIEQLEDRLSIGKFVKDIATAAALYNKYASLKGFSMRNGTNVKSRDGTWLIGKFLLCNCEGFTDNKAAKKKIPDYRKALFRCGCEAKLKIGRQKGDYEWIVTKFETEHNHEMYSSSQVHLLKSSRSVPEDQVMLLNTMGKSRIPPARAYNLLSDCAGGRENVGYTRKDAYDALARANRKARVENRDSVELVQYFMNKANKESNFYWNVEVDEDKHLMNFFFRDNQCRIDCEWFGDVVSFDTTYNTNSFGMKCALFVGINHHHDNVFFGIGFLSDETEESFEWLFRTFLESMDGKQPGVIFTDQCQAAMNAIETVYPCSRNRLCHWHINQNAPGHFGSLKNNGRFKSMWDRRLNYCESEAEFELTWQEIIKMIVTYKVKVDWFQRMYNLRHKWATVFIRDRFNARLLATSRSEGANSALKKMIKNSTATLLCVSKLMKKFKMIGEIKRETMTLYVIIRDLRSW